ncbi:MAG: phosphoribosylamine--glycine ligase [Sediminibacterium sp.]|nr:phosphoribosylamine--glycine ligase [Sediminibacterium sp.]
MNILIIGRGGREHAIAWKIKQSPLVKKIYVSPGNAGTASIAENIEINELDNEGLIKFALENKIDLTIVGPETALMNGIVDAFNNHNLVIFGPNKAAAEIEGSKKFAKELMLNNGIPTAQYASFTDNIKAKNYVQNKSYPIVIKADNLAAGKGVIIAQNKMEAYTAIDSILIDKKFNSSSLIIEDFLEGIEFSLMAFVDGENVYPMEIAQDYKRAFDNHQGPNTGGMGAYSPVSVISTEEIKEAVEKIMIPTAKAMVAMGKPFTGVLYGGLISTKKGVKVIEFNARFGDPETEVILPRLKNDLVEIMINILQHKPIKLNWDSHQTVGVVMATTGYPDKYTIGDIIKLPNLKQTSIFHMGTTFNKKNELCVHGGRVLFIVGKALTKNEARKDVYDTIENIQCDSLFYRKDIGLA